jgi:pimeloyl-ACP methyl ester carboxylesterase
MVGQVAAAAIPTAKTLVYEDCGHSPFWEEPDRFNADLTQFARHCFEMEPGT